jgi:hypothetical protein
MLPVLYFLLSFFFRHFWTRSLVCIETLPAWASGWLMAEFAMASSSFFEAMPSSLATMASRRLLRCAFVDGQLIMSGMSGGKIRENSVIFLRSNSRTRGCTEELVADSDMGRRPISKSATNSSVHPREARLSFRFRTRRIGNYINFT